MNKPVPIHTAVARSVNWFPCNKEKSLINPFDVPQIKLLGRFQSSSIMPACSNLESKCRRKGVMGCMRGDHFFALFWFWFLVGFLCGVFVGFFNVWGFFMCLCVCF